MPSGNQNTAASIPKGSQSSHKHFRSEVGKRWQRRTQNTVLGLPHMLALLQTYHLRMVRGEERGNVLLRHRVDVVIHWRRSHMRD